MKIGYARVSTQDQNLSLQLDALRAAGCERIYQEKASGSDRKRSELLKMLENMRSGDVLVIWRLDRLSRVMAHLVQIVHDLGEKGMGLVSLNNPIDTTTPNGRMIFGVFASLAEYEREVIRERTKAGLDSARRRGQKLGRPTGLSDEAEKLSHMAASLYREGRFSVTQIAEKLSISRSTLYEYLRHRQIPIGKVTETAAGLY